MAAHAPELAPSPQAFALPDDGVYLDCAAYGPPLRAARAAGHAALDRAPGAGTYPAWETAAERLRALAADTLFDGDHDGLALVPSAAYGLATAAAQLPLRRGDAVLVLDGQFPSDLLAWQRRCADVGAHVVVARRAPGAPWAEAVLDALAHTPRVAVASLSQVHWHDGAWIDLDAIAPEVHARGAALMLDLSQSLGALPVELARWRPDFVVSVGYKWLLGTVGLAWLWAAPQWRDRGDGLEQHWGARDPRQVWTFAPDARPAYRAGARRFDAGGVCEPVRLAIADAGLAQIRAWGVAGIARALGALTAAFDQALDGHGLASWATPDRGPHITALHPPRDCAAALAQALHDAGIVCTVRDDGRLRLAPHLHVDAAAMVRVATIVAAVAAHHGHAR